MAGLSVFFLGMIGVFLGIQMLRSPSYMTFLVAVMAGFVLLAVGMMVMT